MEKPIPAQANSKFVPDPNRHLHFQNGDFSAYVLNECMNKKLVIVINHDENCVERYEVVHMSERGYTEATHWYRLSEALDDFGTPIESEPF